MNTPVVVTEGRRPSLSGFDCERQGDASPVSVPVACADLMIQAAQALACGAECAPMVKSGLPGVGHSFVGLDRIPLDVKIRMGLRRRFSTVTGRFNEY